MPVGDIQISIIEPFLKMPNFQLNLEVGKPNAPERTEHSIALKFRP
jgi:hypothetical protein